MSHFWNSIQIQIQIQIFFCFSIWLNHFILFRCKSFSVGRDMLGLAEAIHKNYDVSSSEYIQVDSEQPS